ncbi:MAG TPA: FHA domain-containing protein [Polyangiaceae bacterium]|nr:FHA domain-containing protein [Polyangiaceae bacterium]
MRRWWTRVERLWRPGVSAKLARAQHAEARGELEQATQLYIEAGAHDAAARVLGARASSALTSVERLGLLSLALEYCAVARRPELRREHARLKLELCQSRELYLTRSELAELGRDLAEFGEPQLAADAFGLAGDLEAQTAALVEAGAIERLEAVFAADQSRQRLERDREQTTRNAIDLERLGRRRAVLAVASDQFGDGASPLGELAHRIKTSRVTGPVLRLELAGERHQFVLGDEVTLGRANAAIVVPSPAVSRRHLELRREAGVPVLTDVSKNGTTLRGIPLAGSVPVQSRIELVLGGEVCVSVEPHARYGLELAVSKEIFWAPLGDLTSVVGTFRSGSDDWLELIPPERGIYLNAVHVLDPVQLCAGDEIRPARDAEVAVRVLS